MKLTKINTYKNLLAYVLLFSFINIVNYIPDTAHYEIPVKYGQSTISEINDEESIPTSIVEILFEDFFEFPESKFTYEELKDFSRNTSRCSKIAKSIETPPASILPSFLTLSASPSDYLFNNEIIKYPQFLNTLLHSKYIHFLHLLYPF